MLGGSEGGPKGENDNGGERSVRITVVGTEDPAGKVTERTSARKKKGGKWDPEKPYGASGTGGTEPSDEDSGGKTTKKNCKSVLRRNWTKHPLQTQTTATPRRRSNQV